MMREQVEELGAQALGDCAGEEGTGGSGRSALCEESNVVRSWCTLYTKFGWMHVSLGHY